MWRGGWTSEGEYEKIRPSSVERAEIKIDDVARRSRVSGSERVHKLVVVLGQCGSGGRLYRSSSRCSARMVGKS